MSTRRSFGPLFLLLVASGCGGNGMMGQRGMMTGPGAMGGAGVTSVMSVSPPGNATGVSLTARVVIRFDHAMGTGMEQYVILHQGEITGPLVPMSYAWSGDHTTLTCTPAQPLQRHQRYTLHVGGGMRDANGHAIDLDDMPMMGGQWVMPGNKSYGMMLTFTTE